MKVEKQVFNHVYKKGTETYDIANILHDKVQRMLCDLEDHNACLSYKTNITIILEEVK